MILGFSEDFTSDIILDAELKAVPSSGLYLNSGVHPSITVGNLLDFLPKLDFTFTAWNAGTTYGIFLTSRNRTDIVTYNSKIYQSIKATNLNQNPSTETTYWLETNIESLRLKLFVEQVKNRVYSDLSLTKRLVNNQYIYENGKNEKTLPNDYAAWVIEPKGSDYVSFRINEISIQKDGTTPVNVYIINQNTLLETVQVAPNNGAVSFVSTDISLVGKGDFKIAIDSQNVYVGNATIDPLKFNGFVAYTSNGTGIAPESATYTYNTFGIGVGINITAYMDGTKYIDNNFVDMANYIRATFELMVFEMYLYNSHNRSNRAQRIQLNDEMLIAEVKNMNAETIVRRYHRERKRVIEVMQRTFDTQLNDHSGIEIKIGSA
jgi:hypothetical protein